MSKIEIDRRRVCSHPECFCPSFFTNSSKSSNEEENERFFFSQEVCLFLSLVSTRNNNYSLFASTVSTFRYFFLPCLSQISSLLPSFSLFALHCCQSRASSCFQISQPTSSSFDIPVSSSSSTPRSLRILFCICSSSQEVSLHLSLTSTHQCMDVWMYVRISLYIYIYIYPDIYI